MAARSPYQAPRSIQTFQDCQRELKRVQEALDQVTRSGYVQGLQTHDLTPLAPSFTRVSPPPLGMRAVLPEASEQNAGEAIVFHIEQPEGPLFVFAAPGQTINGLTVNTFTVAGVVALFSNGVDAWSSTSQIPGGIGPGGTPGLPGLNGAASPPGLGASAVYAMTQGSRPMIPGPAGTNGTIGRDGVMGPPGRPGADSSPRIIQTIQNTTTIGTSAVATAVVTLAGDPGALSGTFSITTSGLTAFQQIPVWLAVSSTDPTEAEEQIIFSGLASSTTNINVYWQSVDGTPKIGNRTVAYIPTSGALLSVVGSGNAITVSSVVDLTGSTSTLNLTPTAGDLNVYDISTVQCGGTVTFQSLTATNIDGFTAKNDGFFFFLSIRDATTSEYLTLTDNNGNAVTSIRTPAARGHRMTKNDSIMLYYSNSRWRVCETVPKLWMVSADNVTFAATQNDYARGDRGSAYMRVTLTGSQSLTGVVPDGDAEGFPGGEIMAIQNIDTADELILPHGSVLSVTATNRFSMPIAMDRTIPPGEAGIFRHDGTSDRWRMIASSCDARVLQRVIRITTGAFSATIDPAVTWIRLVGQAGGGGGGGAQAALLREAAAGAGGAGGGYYDIWIPAVAGGGAVSGSVGNGGNGGTTGGSAGSPGGNTTLIYNGVTYTAFGGGAGLGVTSGNGANSAGQLVNMSLGGQGGDSDQTDFEILSGYGGWGMMYAGAAMVNMLAKGGDGGSTFWGNGGLGGLVVGIESIASGSAGGAYGTGGGGGAKIKNAAGATAGQGGNNGAVGIAIIEMYAGPVPTTGIS